MISIYVFILGCLIGSFLNVCIYRIPRKESVVKPRSHCPKCNHNIMWYENIPVISYILILRGRCSKCKKKISLRYPVTELLTGCTWLALYIKFGFTPLTVASILVSTLLIFGTMVDLDHMYIPNRVSIGIMIIGLIYSSIYGLGIESSVIGGAIYGLPFLLIYGYGADLYKKEVMGFGDVKLAVAIGTFLGYINLYTVHMFITVAFVVGAIVGVTMIKLKGKSKMDEIPFGPYIAISGMAMLFYFY